MGMGNGVARQVVKRPGATCAPDQMINDDCAVVNGNLSSNYR